MLLILLLFGAFSAVLILLYASKNERPIRIGTNSWLGYEPLYIAQETGALNPEHIRLLEFSSASEVMRAMKNGLLEAAALTLDETITLLAQGIDLRVLLVTNISDGADALLAQAEYKGVEALQGHRIGVESGALGAYMLSRLAELHQLDLDTVQVVNLPVYEHEAAFQRGEVDAVITFEPVRSKLLEFGAVELFSSRMIFGEIVDVIVVKPEVFKQQPNQIADLYEAWYSALSYMKQQPQLAEESIAERMHLTPQQVSNGYQRLVLPNRKHSERMIMGAEPELLPIAESLTEVVKGYQTRAETIDISHLFETHIKGRH